MGMDFVEPDLGKLQSTQILVATALSLLSKERTRQQIPDLSLKRRASFASDGFHLKPILFVSGAGLFRSASHRLQKLTLNASRALAHHCPLRVSFDHLFSVLAGAFGDPGAAEHA